MARLEIQVDAGTAAATVKVLSDLLLTLSNQGAAVDVSMARASSGINTAAIASNNLAISQAKLIASTAQAVIAQQNQILATNKATASADLSSISQQKLAAATTAAAISQQKLATEQQRTAIASENAAAATDRAALAALRLQAASELSGVESGLSGLERGAEGATVAIERTSSSLEKMALLIGIGFGVHDLIEASDEYTNVNNKLKLVTDSQYGLATAYKSVFNIAQSTRNDLESTAQLYQRLTQSGSTLGVSQEHIAAVTKTLSQAIAFSGATAAQAKGGMIDLSAELARGTFSGNSLRYAMQDLPGVFKTLEVGLGLTAGQLKALADEGNLTSQVFIEGLTKGASYAASQFGKTASTIGQAVTTLNGAQIDFFGKQTESSQKYLVAALSDIQAHIGAVIVTAESLTFGALILGAVNGSKALVASATAAITDSAAKATLASENVKVAESTLIMARSELVLAQDAVAAATAIGVLTGNIALLDAAEVALIGTEIAVEEATVALGVATAEVGTIFGTISAIAFGPIGIIAMGAAVAVGFLMGGKNAIEAKPKLDLLGQSYDQVRTKLEALTEAQRENELITRNKQIANDQGTANNAQTDFFKGTDAAAYSAGSNGNTALRDEINALQTQLKAGSITVDQFQQKILSMRLPDDIKSSVTALAAAWDTTNKAYQEDVKEAGEVAKANAKIASSFHDVSDASSMAAAQLKNDYAASAILLNKDIADRKEAIAKLKDPSNLGAVNRAAALAASVQPDGSVGHAQDPTALKADQAIAAQQDALIASQKAQKDANAESKKALAESLAVQQKYKDEYIKFEDAKLSATEKVNKTYDDQIKLINKAEAGFAASHSRGTDPRSAAALKINSDKASAEKAQVEDDRQADLDALKQADAKKLTAITDYMRSEQDLLAEKLKYELKAVADEHGADKASIDSKRARIAALTEFYYKEVELIKDRDALATKAALKPAADMREQDAHDVAKQAMTPVNAKEFDKEFQIRKKYDDQILQAQNQLDQALAQKDKDALAKQIANLKLGKQAEIDAAKNSAVLQKELQNERLAETSAFFGNLAVLSNSSNKTLATIGRAAAIGQATIDGILAVQKALATIPPPLNFAVAASVGIATAVNVAKIAGVGFKYGGYTGDVGTDDVAGVTHGQEFVMTADKTKQYRPILDAMHNGSFDSSSLAQRYGYQSSMSNFLSDSRPIVPQVQTVANKASTTTIHVHNHGSEEAMIDFLKSEKGGTHIVNQISRNSNKVSRIVQNG
jgi:tape measure domain-containing protein